MMRAVTVLTPLPMRLNLSAALLLGALALPGLGQSAFAAGFEPSFYLVGHKVQLNGKGTAGVQQQPGSYEAGLYLVKPSRSLNEALASPGPKRLQLQVLRELESEQLGRVISQAISANLPQGELGACLAGIARIGEAFGAKKRLKPGDQISLDGVQTQGTHISINGERVGTVEGPAFFSCVLKGYLGEQPKDPALKKALLSPVPPAKK